MKKEQLKIKSLNIRKRRVRSIVTGTGERPRLSVSVSNKHISAQIINDETGKSLAAATTVGKKISGTMTEKAILVGAEIAKNAKKVNIRRVVFDRNGRLYHGRIKALADAAREGGLEF
jgi:large subunit ribosomal protein L18